MAVASRVTKKKGKISKADLAKGRKPSVLTSGWPEFDATKLSKQEKFLDRLQNLIDSGIEIEEEDIPDDMLDVWEEFRDEITPKLAKKNLAFWAAIFSPVILPGIVKGMRSEPTVPQPKVIIKGWQQEVIPPTEPRKIVNFAKKYFEERGLELCKSLTETDLARLKEDLKNNWGKGEEAFSEKFKESYPVSKSRLETIYRSERHISEYAGVMERAKEAGHSYKRWETIGDERTCDVCLAMDGEIVSIDEKFSNGQMFPSAHPNCRCSATTYSEEDYDELPDEYIRQDSAYLQDVSEFIKLNYKCPENSHGDGFGCGGEGKDNQKKIESKSIDSINKKYNISKLEESAKWEHIDSISAYSLDYHDVVNDFLMGNEYDETVSKSYIKEIVNELSTDLKASKLPFDMVVHRGVRYSYVDYMKEIGGFEKGKTFKYKPFMSTSINEDISKFQEKYNGKKIRMEIILPKGARAAYLGNDISMKEDEEEILINSNSTFEVISVTEQDDKILLKWKYILPGKASKQKQDASYLNDVAEQLKLNYKCPENSHGDGFGCGGEGKSGQIIPKTTPGIFHRTNIKTPEFNKWFNDSKVIDAKGSPLQVFHGSPNVGFTEFNGPSNSDIKGTTASLGTWFTDEPFVASEYADPTESRTYKQGAGVYPVYLSIKNPKIYRPAETSEGNTIDPYYQMDEEREKFVEFDGNPFDSKESRKKYKEAVVEGNKKFVENLKANGYDGIIVTNTKIDAPGGEYRINQFCVFASNQIKSVFNTKPTSSSIITNTAYLNNVVEELKLNYNCPTNEKNGNGPGSCGGKNEIHSLDQQRTGTNILNSISETTKIQKNTSSSLINKIASHVEKRMKQYENVLPRRLNEVLIKNIGFSIASAYAQQPNDIYPNGYYGLRLSSKSEQTFSKDAKFFKDFDIELKSQNRLPNGIGVWALINGASGNLAEYEIDHEIGHIVYEYSLSKEDKSKWKQIYSRFSGNQDINSSNSIKSANFFRNPTEGWCEAFSAVANNNDSLLPTDVSEFVSDAINRDKRKKLDILVKNDASYLNDVAEELKLNYKCPKGSHDEGFGCGGEGKSDTIGKVTSQKISNLPIINKLKKSYMPPKDIILELGSKQNFTDPPKLVSKNTINDIIKSGGIQLYRGFSNIKYSNEFKTGKYFIGVHSLGTGIFAASGEKGLQEASIYGDSGEVLHMALDPSAKIISTSDLETIHDKYVNSLDDSVESNNIKNSIRDYGVLAAILGYDGLLWNSPDNNYSEYVLLNRSKIYVQKELSEDIKNTITTNSSYLNDVASFIKQNRKCKVGTYDDSNTCGQKLNSLLADVADFMKLNYKCRKEDSPDGSNKCKLPDESDNTEQKLFDNIKPDKYGSISGSVSKIKEYYINKSLSWKPSNNYVANLKNSDKAIVSNPENSEILSKYIHSSKFINESLRDKKSTENLEYKNKLNKLIDQSPLQQDVILYRGISPEALDKYFPKDKNTTYTETGGFASFSGSEEIAKAYSTALSRDMLSGKELFPGKNPVIIELHAKQGTPGLFVENYEKKQKFDDNIPPLHEVILKTDQKYKLVDVKKEKYYTRYVVESITSMRRNERYLEEVTEFLKLNKKCKAGTFDESNKCGPEKESTSTGSNFLEVSSSFNPELGGFHTTDYKTANSKPLRVISQDKADNPKLLEAIKDLDVTALPSQFMVMKMKAGTPAKYYTKTDSIGVDKNLSSSEMTTEIKKVLASMKTNSAYLHEAADYLILQDATETSTTMSLNRQGKCPRGTVDDSILLNDAFDFIKLNYKCPFNGIDYSCNNSSEQKKQEINSVRRKIYDMSMDPKSKISDIDELKKRLAQLEFDVPKGLYRKIYNNISEETEKFLERNPELEKGLVNYIADSAVITSELNKYPNIPRIYFNNINDLEKYEKSIGINRGTLYNKSSNLITNNSIVQMDEIMKNLTVSDNLVSYSGIDEKLWNKIPKTPGSIFKTNTFISSTLDEKIAKGFSNIKRSNDQTTKYYIEFKIDKGSHAIATEGTALRINPENTWIIGKDGNINSIGSQQEIILDRKQDYQVLSVESGNEYKKIVVKSINDTTKQNSYLLSDAVSFTSINDAFNFIKLNYNCPDSEKVGSGKGSCSNGLKTIDELEPEELDAISDYTRGLSNQISSLLVDGKLNDYEEPTNADPDVSPTRATWNLIETLDKAIESSKPLKPGTYYHGIDDESKYIEGEEFNYLPFMSVTNDIKTASDFGYQENDEYSNHVLKINIPEGMKGIEVSPEYSGSDFPDMEESILPRNIKLKVGKSYIEGNTKITEVDAIPSTKDVKE